jgi:hypothetical protein
MNVDLNMRICNLCDKNEIGDEFHNILECNYFNNVQKKYIEIKIKSAADFTVVNVFHS